MTKSQSKGEKQLAKASKTPIPAKSKARVTLGPPPAFSAPDDSQADPSKSSSSSSVGPQSASKKGRSPAKSKKTSHSSNSPPRSSSSSSPANSAEDSYRASNKFATFHRPKSSAKTTSEVQNPLQEAPEDGDDEDEEHTDKTSIVIFSPSQKSQGDSQLPSFSSSSSAAATSSYPFSSSSSSAATSSYPFSIVTTEQVPAREYSFEYLTLLNESSGEVTNTELRDQLVNGSKRVLDGLIHADNDLKRYFFEMILVAYKLKITSPEGLVNFLKHTWRVRLLPSHQLPHFHPIKKILEKRPPPKKKKFFFFWGGSFFQDFFDGVKMG